ncbi:hypothetical protein ACTVZO_39080 [Streptomyces sp. IBSNAI002]
MEYERPAAGGRPVGADLRSHAVEAAYDFMIESYGADAGSPAGRAA